MSRCLMSNKNEQIRFFFCVYFTLTEGMDIVAETKTKQ